eukprot:743340-Amphidinium_carterae.3
MVRAPHMHALEEPTSTESKYTRSRACTGGAHVCSTLIIHVSNGAQRGLVGKMPDQLTVQISGQKTAKYRHHDIWSMHSARADVLSRTESLRLAVHFKALKQPVPEYLLAVASDMDWAGLLQKHASLAIAGQTGSGVRYQSALAQLPGHAILWRRNIWQRTNQAEPGRLGPTTRLLGQAILWQHTSSCLLALTFSASSRFPCMSYTSSHSVGLGSSWSAVGPAECNAIASTLLSLTSWFLSACIKLAISSVGY